MLIFLEHYVAPAAVSHLSCKGPTRPGRRLGTRQRPGCLRPMSYREQQSSPEVEEIALFAEMLLIFRPAGWTAARTPAGHGVGPTTEYLICVNIDNLGQAI